MYIQVCNNDFTCDKIIYYILLWINIGLTCDESFFGGEEYTNENIDAYLHDAIFEPSGIFTHIATVLIDM